MWNMRTMQTRVKLTEWELHCLHWSAMVCTGQWSLVSIQQRSCFHLFYFIFICYIWSVQSVIIVGTDGLVCNGPHGYPLLPTCFNQQALSVMLGLMLVCLVCTVCILDSPQLHSGESKCILLRASILAE